MRSAGPRQLGKRAAYAPGFVFAGIGLALAGWGLLLAAQRVFVVLSWPEAQAVVTESRIETRGSQHAARVRVRFESPEGPVETEPAHDHRYSNHASIAEALEGFPKGGDARYDPEDPQRAWLEAGFNLATFGLSLLLIGVGIVFAGVGAIEARSWPVVSARVERGDVYSRSSQSARPGKGGVTHYVARLFVAYEHEKRSFVSPLDAGSSRDRQESERLVASIPKGEPRTVKLNPRRPNRISGVDSWPLVFPTAFLAAGLVVSAVAVWLLRR